MSRLIRLGLRFGLDGAALRFGANLLKGKNPDFENDRFWMLGSDIEISNGTLNFHPSVMPRNATNRVPRVFQNARYLCVMDIPSWTAGNVRFNVGGTVSQWFSSAGEASALLLGGVLHDDIIIQGDAAADLSVDNIEVRRVVGKP